MSEQSRDAMMDTILTDVREIRQRQDLYMMRTEVHVMLEPITKAVDSASKHLKCIDEKISTVNQKFAKWAGALAVILVLGNTIIAPLAIYLMTKILDFN